MTVDTDTDATRLRVHFDEAIRQLDELMADPSIWRRLIIMDGYRLGRLRGELVIARNCLAALLERQPADVCGAASFGEADTWCMLPLGHRGSHESAVGTKTYHWHRRDR